MPNKKIKVLDKKTVNQIAAGEVVERPASVVKELVENAIDAHGKKIVIELEGAGRKLIRVTDDGDGIGPDDVKLAFEKHSTSKIDKINDIFKLSTLGFRGEALASIAAVALVNCITCDGEHIPGRKLYMEGGVVMGISEIGCAKGTTIKVKDLFYNLPARYKYLKSDQTELAHIIDVVTQIAICHSSIGFKLIHNGHELLNFPAVKDMLNNLVNIYGKELVRNLLPVTTQAAADEQKTDHDQNQDTEDGPISISGYISKPSMTRGDRTYQSLYVNDRHVQSRVVSDAIKDAYRTLVMKNRHPVAILFININPGEVDVNISPTKLQARFKSERTIYKLIHKAVQDTLRSHDMIPEVKVTSKPQIQTVSLKAITTFGVGKPGYYASLPAPHEQSRAATQMGKQPPDPYTPTIGQGIRQSLLKPETRDTTQEIHALRKTSTLPEIEPIGQILDTYIIAQAGESLIIIDQHAAHERIMYEKIKHRYNAMSMSTQELLEPVELELTPKERGLLQNNLDIFKELNFVIDELGRNSYFVKGIPIILGRLQAPEILHDIINGLINVTKEKEPERIKEEMIQIMACKAAIKAGKSLSLFEIRELLGELYSIENPYTCAHGRPTIISVTDNQLRKLFKRIV